MLRNFRFTHMILEVRGEVSSRRPTLRFTLVGLSESCSIVNRRFHGLVPDHELLPPRYELLLPVRSLESYQAVDISFDYPFLHVCLDLSRMHLLVGFELFSSQSVVGSIPVDT